MTEQLEEEAIILEILHLQDRILNQIMEIGIRDKAEGREGFQNFSMRSQLRLRNLRDSRENQEKTLIHGGLWSRCIYTINP